MTKSNNPARTLHGAIMIWDLPLRVFHWAMVASVCWSWVSIELLEDMQQHFWAGYSVLTLLVFRLLWGIFGTYYSRFGRLWYTPKKIVGYIRSLRSESPQRYAGHNPLGGLAVILMLCILIAQTATGLFSSDDYFFGPLAGLVDQTKIAQLTDLHHRNFELIKVIIGLHILAIIVYRWLKKETLTSAMLTGKKEAHLINGQAHPIKRQKKFLGLLLLLLSAVIVYSLVELVAEPVALEDSFYY
jgi:cytochrome b